MDLLEVANRRSVPGILIFNHRQEPIFFNPVALGIFSKLNGTHSDSNHLMMGVTIPKEIFNLYENLKKSYLACRDDHQTQVGPQISLFSTQDAMYCCRGFPLNGDTTHSDQAFHIMMLIEKVSQHRQIDLEKLRNRFQLTNRQMEIIKHLFSGLTNKRIADALCVSEDTIKGHLKHIMRRLKVNSRTEILSIILQL
jgi:DNA-binding CsgD family transcriptional regulator